VNIRRFDPDEEGALQALLESDPAYAERITGAPPGPSDALSLLIGRPEGVDPADKVVLGGWEGERLVGVLDLIRGYPDADRVFVGLLLIDPSARGRGLGRELLGAIEAHRGSASVARLSIVDANAGVTGFWEREGFRPTGETRPWRYGRVESVSRLFERPLPL
jgi:GNAT superfamily N-acetyltransferase